MTEVWEITRDELVRLVRAGWRVRVEGPCRGGPHDAVFTKQADERIVTLVPRERPP